MSEIEAPLTRRGFLAGLSVLGGPSAVLSSSQDAQASATGSLKPVLAGLIVMGRVGFLETADGVPDNSMEEVASRLDMLGGTAVLASWGQLQPGPDQFDFRAIDSALATIRAHNRASPRVALGVRLRIFGGAGAPAWVKGLGGDPITVQRGERTRTIGGFWRADYQAAWRGLQNHLAQRYDADPLVRDVAMSSCASLSAEPFVLPQNRLSLSALRAAGLTDRLYLASLSSAVEDYAAWRQTRVEFPFNAFVSTDSGRPMRDPAAAIRIMKDWRHALGAKLVLANHALTAPPRSQLTEIFAAMQSLGPPISFQTFAPTGIDWDATVDYAARLGANAMEVWNRVLVDTSPGALKHWSATLQRSASPG